MIRFLTAWVGAAVVLASANGAEPKVLGTVGSFAASAKGPYQRGHLDSWRWSAETRETLRQQSRLEIDDGSLRVKVEGKDLFANEPLSILRLAPFYPPETDAIRLRIKVLSGQAVLHLGGPTAYYGNSDVYTERKTIKPENPPRFVDVDFSVHAPLWRNFRRSGFSTDAPRNYYNRWAQEPIGLFANEGTTGEFLIERIELVAKGQAKPFPIFAKEDVVIRKPIANFEDGKLNAAFTLYMANSEVEWFEQSWKREKPLRFSPAVISIESHDGGRCLQTKGAMAEEVQCVGVKTTGAEANAIALRMYGEAPDQQNTLVGAGEIVPVDFLVFTSPDPSAFAWSRFGPPDDWRKLPNRGFDYHISYQSLRDVKENFAIYQTRRYLVPKAWTSLVLPAADFTCVYGHGSERECFLKHEPLDCKQVMAVAWLSPWCRSGRGPVTYRVDDLAFVNVPGKPEEHRSFWQIDTSDFTLADETRGRTRIRTMSPKP